MMGLRSGAWLVPAAMLLLPPKASAQLFLCDDPQTVSSGIASLGLTGLQLVSGQQQTYKSAQSSCPLVTEKGPRALSLYKACLNYACQAGLELGGVGVIASLEANLRSRMTTQQGNAWFGFQARTGVKSVTADRRRVEGWHRVELMLMGAVLPLPVHRLWVTRTNGPVNLQTQYGVPFHTTTWTWDRRDVVLTAVVPTPLGNGAITLRNTDATARRTRGSRETFYQATLNSSLGDRGDWDWYLSPSEKLAGLDLSTTWSLEFASPAVGKNFGFAEATIRAFARGGLTGTFQHSEGEQWASLPDVSLPEHIYRRQGVLTTGNKESVTATDLEAGLRLAFRAAWYEWREEWSFGKFTGSQTMTSGTTRNSAVFDQIWGDKYAPAYALSPCTTTPPPRVPDWLRLTIGSPVPPPDDDSNPNIPAFTEQVGRTVAEQFIVCPIATVTNEDVAALERIRQSYEALRFRDPVTAKRNACASLTSWYRAKYAICTHTKGNPGGIAQFTRGRTECDLLI